MIETRGGSETGSATEHAKGVHEYFSGAAVYWRSIYSDERLIPLVYRERRMATLEWVSRIAQPPGARALEVGCGAGLTSVALAERGYFVEAMDSTREMIALAREEAYRAGVASRLHLSLGDVHRLEFADGDFDLVMAVGIVPWLHSEAQAVREMARVLKPGGYLIVTADNAARLNRLLDPLATPLLTPVRRALKSAVRLIRGPRPAPLVVKKHYPRQVDSLAAACGLVGIDRRTIGFGPFTFCGIQVLTDRAGVKVHSALQRLAGRNVPGLRLTGSHYLLLARKRYPGHQGPDRRKSFPVMSKL